MHRAGESRSPGRRQCWPGLWWRGEKVEGLGVYFGGKTAGLFKQQMGPKRSPNRLSLKRNFLDHVTEKNGGGHRIKERKRINGTLGRTRGPASRSLSVLCLYLRLSSHTSTFCPLHLSTTLSPISMCPLHIISHIPGTKKHG